MTAHASLKTDHLHVLKLHATGLEARKLRHRHNPSLSPRRRRTALYHG